MLRCLGMLGYCLGIAWVLLGYCLGIARVLLGYCLGMLGYAWVLLWHCFGSARVCSGIWVCSGIARVLPGYCSGIAWVLLGYFLCMLGYARVLLGYQFHIFLLEITRCINLYRESRNIVSWLIISLSTVHCSPWCCCLVGHHFKSRRDNPPYGTLCSPFHGAL